MNFNDYQEQAEQFAAYRNTIYPLLGLAEEVGEFLGLAAKAERGDDMVARYGSREAILEAFMKEAGDVLWMLTACLSEADITLQDVAELNLKKLTDRKERDVIKGSGDNR